MQYVCSMLETTRHNNIPRYFLGCQNRKRFKVRTEQSDGALFPLDNLSESEIAFILEWKLSCDPYCNHQHFKSQGSTCWFQIDGHR